MWTHAVVLGNMSDICEATVLLKSHHLKQFLGVHCMEYGVQNTERAEVPSCIQPFHLPPGPLNESKRSALCRVVASPYRGAERASGWHRRLIISLSIKAGVMHCGFATSRLDSVMGVTSLFSSFFILLFSSSSSVFGAAASLLPSFFCFS